MRKLISLFTIITLVFSCKTEKENSPSPENKGTPPEVTTNSVSFVSAKTIKCGGVILSTGTSEITSRGVCWSSSENPTVESSSKTIDGSGEGAFTSSILDLIPQTTYYIRAYATNKSGTTYGAQISATTLSLSLPTVTTLPPFDIAQNSAKSGGEIQFDGNDSISAKGICWGTRQLPNIEQNPKTEEGQGKGNFTSQIGNLSPDSTYYIRAYATNSAGTSYGNQVCFTNSETDISITDIDGNTYQSVKIGNQVWMKSNLKTTHYKNGNQIPNLTGSTWANSTVGAYDYYDHNIINQNTLGNLYNWYAVVDPRGLCPAGWHVPTDHDWNILTKFLNPDCDTIRTFNSISSCNSAGKLKDKCIPWGGAVAEITNETGFSALPAGGIRPEVSYHYISKGYYGIWWSSTRNPEYDNPIYGNAYNNMSGYYRYLFYTDNNIISTSGFKNWGSSVRCIKD